MIVVVALLLGFSLNMFQFRNPFRSPAADYADAPQVAEKSRSPGRQEGLAPIPPAASQLPVEEKPGKSVEVPSGAIPVGRQELPPKSGTSEQAVPEAAHPQVPSVPTIPAAPALPEPLAAPDSGTARTVADVSPPRSESALVTITVEHDKSELTQPKVTSEPSRAKAGKIGRQVPADVPAQQAADAKSEAGAQMPAPVASVGTAAPADMAARNAGKPAPQGEQAEVGSKASAAKSAGNGADKAPAKPEAATGAETSTQPAQPQPETAVVDAEKATTPRGTRILEIKTQDKPGEFVLNIVTDGPVERVTSFHAKGPARLAVDLQGSWQTTLGASLPVEGELFERVRVGAHPDKLRLVIDYRDKELATFSEQIVEKQPKGVLVRIPKAKPKP